MTPLPCPFCGAAAFATYKTGDDDLRRHSVHCHEQSACGAQTRGHFSEAAAIGAWNRRTDKAAIRAAHDRGYSIGWDHGKEHASAPAAQQNGCGSVSFKLSDGSTVSCDWSANEWELVIPANRHGRDVAFKELLQEIGRLRAISTKEN